MISLPNETLGPKFSFVFQNQIEIRMNTISRNLCIEIQFDINTPIFSDNRII